MDTFEDRVKRFFMTMLIMAPVIIGKVIINANHHKHDIRNRYQNHFVSPRSSSHSMYYSDTYTMTADEFLEKYKMENDNKSIEELLEDL